jgi:hypothetical protein
MKTHLVPLLENADVSAWNDAEAAAYLWLSNTYLCRSLLETWGGRICILDGDDIANRARETLLSVAKFLDIPLPNDRLVEVLNDWSCSMHSKDLITSFDAEKRALDLAGANARFGAEADVGVKWAAKVALEWISDCPYRAA